MGNFPVFKSKRIFSGIISGISTINLKITVGK